MKLKKAIELLKDIQEDFLQQTESSAINFAKFCKERAEAIERVLHELETK